MDRPETLEKPEITLNHLEKTAIEIQTQKDFNKLMQVFELAGLKWRSGDLPTSRLSLWKEWYKSDTCVAVALLKGNKENKGIEYGHEQTFIDQKYTRISLNKFYEVQNITPEKLEGIDAYFKKKQ